MAGVIPGVSMSLIKDFKSWISELGIEANEWKDSQEKSTGKRPNWTNPHKNKDIKNKFAVKGKQRPDIQVRSSAEKNKGEWLYDLVWRKLDSNQNLIGIELAMEIELSSLGTSGLVYDFNKLLQSDADYKIFVYQQKSVVLAETIANDLKTRKDIYNSKVDSAYLLACWCWDSAEFKYWSF